MRIAYLTQVQPSSTQPDIALPPQTTEAMAKRGHQILVMAAGESEYSYHISRNNITIVQLRLFKCPLFIGGEPVFLPVPTILRSLYKFQPDIIYMDMTGSLNWIGYVYSFVFNVPARSTPVWQIRTIEQS